MILIDKRIFLPLYMEKSNKTLTYWESAKYILAIVTSNPLFKIVLLPIILLSVLAAKFVVYVLMVVADIDMYFSTSIKKESPEALMIRYMCTPFFHYVIILLNEIIISFFISSIIRQSFCAFTNEYVLVNYDTFHSLGSGQIHAIIQRRLFAIEDFLKLLILNVFHDLTFICIAFYKVYTDIDHRAFYANVLLFIVYLVIMWYIIKMRVYFRLKFNDTYNIVSNKCYSILVNYDVIKSYTNEELELKKLDENLQKVQYQSIIFSCITSFAEFAQKNALVIPNGYILYLALTNTIFTKMNSSSGFLLYNKLFLDVKTRVSKITQDVLKVSQCMTDISDSRIVEAKLDEEYRGINITSFKKSIVFDNVDLYINNLKICIGINLTINKGDKIAIVGKNGSGKSTFLNALLRMREYEGSIQFDDIEMDKISKYSQRNIISYIPQNPGIKEGTILENLKYGKSNISDEKIFDICKEYGSHKIFSNLSEGYHTEAGEMGKYLSGGQKQRVSFIRGVIKNGDIFIYDEHTSNLDSSSQNELIDYIFTSLKFKTSIVILHKQSHLEKFDKIFGFYNGKIRVYNNYNKYLEDHHLY